MVNINNNHSIGSNQNRQSKPRISQNLFNTYLQMFNNLKTPRDSKHLLNSSYDDAVLFLNESLKFNYEILLSDLIIIYKKFQTNHKWLKDKNADLNFIDDEEQFYKFILSYSQYLYTSYSNKNQDVKKSIEKLHAKRIEFFATHHVYFNSLKSGKVIEEAEKIFHHHKNKYTFGSLINALEICGEYAKAESYVENTAPEHLGRHHEHYLRVLSKLYHFEESWIHYNNALSEMGPYEHRQLLDLFRLKIKWLNKNHETSSQIEIDNLVINAYEAYKNAIENINDQIFRAMLKVFLIAGQLDNAENLFNEIESLTQQNILKFSLSDSSYWMMIKGYWVNSYPDLAYQKLTAAFDRSNFKLNQIQSNGTSLTLDLHTVGVTGGGKPFRGGKDNWSLLLFIHDLFQKVIDGKYGLGLINVVIICGKGKHEVYKAVQNIFDIYNIESVQGSNPGRLNVTLNYKVLADNSNFYLTYRFAKSGHRGKIPTCYLPLLTKSYVPRTAPSLNNNSNEPSSSSNESNSENASYQPIFKKTSTSQPTISDNNNIPSSLHISNNNNDPQPMTNSNHNIGMKK